jgi:hypothetical protein
MSGVYAHNWPYDWGYHNPGLGIGADRLDGPLGHRQEMVFINGLLMEQRLSEDPSSLDGGFEYLILEGECGGPFCVNEGANRIYIKPRSDIDVGSAVIEVAVRKGSVFSIGRDNTVLRNIVIQHVARTLEASPLGVHGEYNAYSSDAAHRRNVLVENVIVRFCNGDGLGWGGVSHSTLRNCKFLNNGERGINGAYINHCVWDNVEFSYNQWRADMGNAYAWAGGEFKGNWCGKHTLFRRVKAWGRHRSLAEKAPVIKPGGYWPMRAKSHPKCTAFFTESARLISLKKHG